MKFRGILLIRDTCTSLKTKKLFNLWWTTLTEESSNTCQKRDIKRELWANSNTNLYKTLKNLQTRKSFKIFQSCFSRKPLYHLCHPQILTRLEWVKAKHIFQIWMKESFKVLVLLTQSSPVNWEERVKRVFLSNEKYCLRTSVRVFSNLSIKGFWGFGVLGFWGFGVLSWF